MAKKKENETESGVAERESISLFRDGIASIEAFVEMIPTYYKVHIQGAKPRGHHTANERARCFREATILRLADARGWLGKALGALGSPTPYPQSDNANSPVIEPPAYNKSPSMEMGDPVAAIKSARAQIGNMIDGLDAAPADLEGAVKRYVSLSKTALESARLTLGEELGILGGH